MRVLLVIMQALRGWRCRACGLQTSAPAWAPLRAAGRPVHRGARPFAALLTHQARPRCRRAAERGQLPRHVRGSRRRGTHAHAPPAPGSCPAAQRARHAPWHSGGAPWERQGAEAAGRAGAAAGEAAGACCSALDAGRARTCTRLTAAPTPLLLTPAPALPPASQPASSSESGKSTGDGSSVLYSSLVGGERACWLARVAGCRYLGSAPTTADPPLPPPPPACSSGRPPASSAACPCAMHACTSPTCSSRRRQRP
jgi:hypothetical protein